MIKSEDPLVKQFINEVTIALHKYLDARYEVNQVAILDDEIRDKLRFSDCTYDEKVNVLKEILKADAL